MDRQNDALAAMAKRLRRHSLTSTSKARSGHPTTCLSSADLVAALFFKYLSFDIENPRNRANDRFVLSKGHAAPLLWAVLAEAGAFPTQHLETLRRIDSDLEGHPTPRNRWVDVSSGSLGQGLSVGVGMAISSKIDRIDNQVFVLMGDGECAEGSIWEAAALASHRNLDNLIGIVDVNGLGQSQRTMFDHDLDVYERRFQAFGWATCRTDGHNLDDICGAYEWALAEQRPAAIIAHTFKGEGVSFLSDKDGWHGKPLNEDELAAALAELDGDTSSAEALEVRRPSASHSATEPSAPIEPPTYAADDLVATRRAYGTALRKLGASDPEVVALDGDTKNSTYSQDFLAEFPDRFVECFIAEQNMIGAALGFSALGKIPFSSTFAAFLTRAYDQIRMGSISRANLKICGSHAGVSIGEDGPSQMGLEDLAMMRAVAGSTVFYPSDAVSSERIVALAAQTPGIVYIRTTRPATPILYGNDESFRVGGSRVLRTGDNDQATLVGAGITLHEALRASDELLAQGIAVRVIDLYCVKPVDRETLLQAADDTGLVVTVEDHYPEGGLGDAVAEVLSGTDCIVTKMAVTGLPQSGPPEALREAFGISSERIVQQVRSLLATPRNVDKALEHTVS